ncbi:MAG: ROK family protein [Aeriscardovia sp.]|nr:ROK family protein [Aeriscardovia sp.]
MKQQDWLTGGFTHDTDAVVLGEDCYGAIRQQLSLVIVTTLGTSIGSTLIHHGTFDPTIELNYLELEGRDAKVYAFSHPPWQEPHV